MVVWRISAICGSLTQAQLAVRLGTRSQSSCCTIPRATTGRACRSPLVGDPRRGVRCSRAVLTRGPRLAGPALVGRATRGMDDPTNVGWSKPQLSPQNGSPSSAKSM